MEKAWRSGLPTCMAESIVGPRVNWVLDLDIKSFFDQIGHDWMVKFVEHRIGDERIVRLIQKRLKAGVMENGRWFERIGSWSSCGNGCGSSGGNYIQTKRA
ncbi:MAG: hypothetical protein AAB225_10340 [Acidobacteriota bacterium]